MANKIILKKSSVAGKVPLATDLDVGEVALNLTDKLLYSKDAGGTVISIGGGSMVYPGAGIPNSTGTAWGTSYTTTGTGTVVALQNSPSLTSPTIDGASPYIQFNNGSAVTLAAGRMWYNGSTGSWNLGMGGGNITQQVGEEIFVYGKASAAITEGQLVMKTGVVGASGVITFAPTSANLTDDLVIIGIATENIPLNGFGRVTSFGVVHGIDTSAFVDGATLWYDPTSSTGGMTSTKPSAPNAKCNVGVVINAGSGGSGSIQVEINHGSTLGGTDNNVQLSSASNGQILTYDGSATYWRNTSLTAGTGISVSAATNGVLTVTNSAPDQTVSITGTSPISVTGTYPNFTASISQSNTSTNGYLSSTDWNTFNGKQTAYTNLSTIGALANGTGWLYNNGTGTFSYSTPTAADVGAVPTSRTLTINGTTYDLTANRTWSVGTVTSVAALTLGTTGTDLSSSVATGTTTPVITLNVPTASATNRGALSAADWTTFNNKGSGSVTSVSVVSANGFAGTVATSTTTPAITLSTSITGVLKGNGTAISAAVSGTDYAPATSGTSILYGNGSGGFSNVTVGTGLTFTGGTLASTSAPISFVYDQFTATASQTTFNTSQSYFSGKIAVYRNGALMRNGTDVTVTSGAQVVFAVALTAGDLIDVNYPPNADASKYKYDQFTATASQTIFTTSGTYTSGKIEVFVNGAKYRNGTDCTVTSGTSVVMATGLNVGDLVDINYPVA